MHLNSSLERGLSPAKRGRGKGRRRQMVSSAIGASPTKKNGGTHFDINLHYGGLQRWRDEDQEPRQSDKPAQPPQPPAARGLPPPQQRNPVPTPPRRTPIVPPFPKQSLPPTSPRCPRTRPPFLHLTPTSLCQPPRRHTPAQHCCYNKPAVLPKFHYRRALRHSRSWGFNALKIK